MFIDKAGIESMYLYIVHPVLLNLLRMIFIRIDVQNVIIWIVALFLFGVVGGYSVALVAKKLWFLEFLFKPQKYIKMNRI